MAGRSFSLADFTFAVACNSHGTVAVALNVSISFVKAVGSGTLVAQDGKSPSARR